METYKHETVNFSEEEVRYLRTLFQEHARGYRKHIDKIIYSKFDGKCYLREVIKMFDNGIHSISNVCPVCGKEKPFKRFACSSVCSNRLPFVREKYKQTSLERYGTEHPFQFEGAKEKYKQTSLERYGTESYSKTEEYTEKKRTTCLEKFGCEHAFQNEEIKEKRRQTNLERYGTENPTSTKEVQEKYKQTCLERYGVEFYSQTEEHRNKIKETCLERYGCECAFQSKEVQEKAKKTNLERYGVEHSMQSEDLKEKRKDTCLEKYGCEYVSQSEDFKDKLKRTVREKRYFPLVEQLEGTKYILKDSFKEFIENEEHVYYCTKHDKDFISKCTCIQTIHCPHCIDDHNVISFGHFEVLEFLKKHYQGEIIVNTRKVISPLELDIYIPEHNLAIEFDGLYWHSELHKDKNYHLNKTELCNENGIQLIHIFENEWMYKQDIVKSIILSKLGIFQERIFARKCEIKEVATKEAREFIELNHLQGYVGCSKKIGLYFENELVEIITVGKSRFKKDEQELIRHCTKLRTQVVGGFSRLIKHYGSSLVSYVDRRYFNGKGYEATGWKLQSISVPNYFYTKGFVLESRQKYQKHKLGLILENFSHELSENENMLNNGFFRIYDCGNIKYTKYI